MTKKILRVLAGEVVWPPPVWLLRQAGRYLPEYRAIRNQAGDFITLATTPAMATEVTLQPVRRFGMDAAILFSDILMVPWALGQGLRFEPIRDAADVAALQPERLDGGIAPILEAVRRVRANVGDATLIGFAGGPFTVACYMVEGGGSKDFVHIRTMAWREPALFAALMEIVTQATITYLSAQIQAGAEAVMLFDSWAGVLSPQLFRQHVIQPTARIVQALAVLHPGVPVIGFPRLAGVMLAEYVQATGVRAVHLDTSMDPVLVAGLLPEDVAVQGNLDPIALLAGGTAMTAEVTRIRDALRGRAHIFNLGHGIVPQTNPDHVASVVKTLRTG